MIMPVSLPAPENIINVCPAQQQAPFGCTVCLLSNLSRLPTISLTPFNRRLHLVLFWLHVSSTMWPSEKAALRVLPSVRPCVCLSVCPVYGLLSRKQKKHRMLRTFPSFVCSSSSSSIYLDKTKHKCQGHVGTYRHHSNMHDRAVMAVQ